VAYLAGICRNYEMIARRDRRHGETTFTFYFIFRPSLPWQKPHKLLKRNSSKWIGEQGIEFAWQEGYGAFSVSSSNLGAVARYIANQESHHRKFSFEEEFRALLEKHGVEYDPKYMFG